MPGVKNSETALMKVSSMKKTIIYKGEMKVEVDRASSDLAKQMDEIEWI